MLTQDSQRSVGGFCQTVESLTHTLTPAAARTLPSLRSILEIDQPLPIVPDPEFSLSAAQEQERAFDPPH